MTESTFLITIAFILFALGGMTALVRRNILVVLMGIELMLNAACLLFVIYSYTLNNIEGHIAVTFIFVIGAVEVAVAVAIKLGIYKQSKRGRKKSN